MDEIVTTAPEPGHPDDGLAKALENVSNEELLETLLARLADDPGPGAAIAASAVEEALRQLRKCPRAACV